MTRTERAAKAAVAVIFRDTSRTTDKQAEQLREVARLLMEEAADLHDPNRPYPSRSKPNRNSCCDDPDSDGSWSNVVKAYEDHEP